jgi:hypothetical protein
MVVSNSLLLDLGVMLVSSCSLLFKLCLACLVGSKSQNVHQGSITGAYSALTEDVTPSFILLAIQENKLVCYVYELNKGEVEVSKTEFTKKVSEAYSPALLQSLLS